MFEEWRVGPPVPSTRSDLAGRSAIRRRPTRTASTATGTALPSGRGNRRRASRARGATTSTSRGSVTPASALPDSSANLAVAAALPHQAEPPEHAACTAVLRARTGGAVGVGAVVRMRNLAVTAGAQPSRRGPRRSVFGVDRYEHQTLPPTVTKLPTGGRHDARPFRSGERRWSSRQPDPHRHAAPGRRSRSTASWHRSARTNRTSAPLSQAGHPLHHS
jgi:hypothetical protein